MVMFVCRLGVRVFSLVFLLASAALAGAQTIEYTVSIPAPEQRWLQVDVRFPSRAGTPLEVRMARSSPGRYAPHEFGKNVYMFEARGGDATLAAELLAPAHWRITPTGDTVHVRYRLFADHIDGTYASVDGTHAHLNVPATFAWAPSLPDTPIRVRFTQPPGRTWRVSTQLFPTDDALAFTAPNLQYFMDSPIEFSAHAVREFTVARSGGGAPARIRLAVHHLGTDAQLDAYVPMVEKIVREQAAVFGDLAPFDDGTYTFLMDYLPWADGDGMEHRNSTVCTSSAALADGAHRIAGTASHEFFHSWNVERIRPASLEPFDFSRPNMSGELWLAEGFTSYYGVLTLVRAGLISQDQGAAQLATFAAGVMGAPGATFRSAVDMSRLAPYVDAAEAVDPTNWENTFVSYYTYGAAVALGLDLTLRERSGGSITLDDYMRQLWKTHGAPGGKAPGYVSRPYTLQDAQAALATVSGDAAFADDFFRRHVLGTELMPYKRLLAAAGYTIRAIETPATLGQVRLKAEHGRMIVDNNTISTSPVYKAGLGRGDAVLSLNGTAIAQVGDWERVVSTLTPGSEVELTFESRGEKKSTRVAPEKNGRIEVVPSAERTPQREAFRAAWLGSKVK
jgi:predicted metalloprotease with PDZ domain